MRPVFHAAVLSNSAPWYVLFMASRTVHNRKSYTAAKTSRGDWTNPTDRPVALGDNTAEGRDANGSWVRYVLPLSAEIVELKIPEGADPQDALRDWAVRNVAQRRGRKVPLDLEELLLLWNYGRPPHMKRDSCGFVHLEGGRSVEWGGHVGRAIKVWGAHGQRGLHPQQVLTCLEPGARVPFLPSLGATTLAPHKHWLYVAVDISRPLDDQLSVIERACKTIREYAFDLAQIKADRPGRRESSRDVLVYTLRHSALMTIPEIAKDVFPTHDPDSSARTVKEILRKVEAAMAKHAVRPPRVRRTRRNPVRTE